MAPEPVYRLRLEAATLPNALVQHAARLDSVAALAFRPRDAVLDQPGAFGQVNLATQQLVEIKSYGSDFTAFAAPSLAVFTTLGGLEIKRQLTVSNNDMITISVDAFLALSCNASALRCSRDDVFV